MLRGLAIVLLGLLAACAPAPVRLAQRPPVSNLSLPLNGEYHATVTAPFIGPVSGRLIAEPARTGFVAISRPDVAWSMIGGLEGFLGQIFAPHLFPGGVIVTWTSSLPQDGRPGDGWISVGGLRFAGVRTRMHAPDKPIELLAPDGRRVALLTLRPASDDDPPPADYQRLAENIERAVRDRLFDPRLARAGQVRAYLRHLRANARIARDDVEFIFGATVAARNNVKFSIPIVIRRANSVTRNAFPSDDPERATVRASYNRYTRIATLSADAFIDPDEVDAAFERILRWQPRGLLIDISNCPGVTLASLRVASWLFDHPIDAGFFFGPTRRDDGLAGRVDGFPRAEIDSASAVTRAESLIDGADAANVIALPAPRVYRGPVAVVVSRRTTTSAEPLAWLLQATGRARLFGQTTAGRPMISRPVDIGQGWDYWLATADYRPPTGERFNEQGVVPDVQITRQSARRAALRWLYTQRYAPDERRDPDDRREDRARDQDAVAAR